MDIDEYLKIMHFPKEWAEWGMLPDMDYMNELIALYKPGDEDASEHDRNGVFHWWLKKEPPEVVLTKLVKLTYLEPDPFVARDIRNRVKNSKYYSNNVEAALNNAL